MITNFFIFDKLIRNVATFLMGLLTAKSLGVELFGQYSSILAVFSMFSALALFALEAPALRYFAKDGNEINNYLVHCVFIRIVMSTIACVFVYLYMAFFDIHMIGGGVPIIIYMFSYSLYFGEYFLRANLNAKLIFFSSLTQLFISFIIKIIGYYFNLKIEYFVFSATLDIFLYGFVSYIIFLKTTEINSNGKIHLKLNVDRVKKIILSSLPLVLSGLCMGVYRNYDLVFLGRLDENDFSGLYAMSIKLISGCFIIPVVLCNVYLKKLVNSEENYLSNIRSLFIKISVMCLVLYTSYLYVLIPIVVLVLGNEYKEIFDIGVYVGLFIFNVSLDLFIQNHLINKKMNGEILYVSITTTIVTLILMSILYNIYSHWAVVITMLVSYPISVIINLCRKNWRFEIKGLFFAIFRGDFNESRK